MRSKRRRNRGGARAVDGSLLLNKDRRKPQVRHRGPSGPPAATAPDSTARVRTPIPPPAPREWLPSDGGELPVPVPDQEPRPAARVLKVHDQVLSGLRHPRGSRVRSRTQDPNASAGVLEHRQRDAGRAVSEADVLDDGVRGGIDHTHRVRVGVRHIRMGAVRAQGHEARLGADADGGGVDHTYGVRATVDHVRAGPIGPESGSLGCVTHGNDGSCRERGTGHRAARQGRPRETGGSAPSLGTHGAWC